MEFKGVKVAKKDDFVFCFHDTYQFVGPICQIPTGELAKDGNDKVYEHSFCSPNCGKKWRIEKGGNNIQRSLSRIVPFYKKNYNYVPQKHGPILMAKPREYLKPYFTHGVQIDEFRRGFFIPNVVQIKKSKE